MTETTPPASLFAVYLGGPVAEGRMGEDHEVVFVVGSDPRDVRRRARAKWGGIGKAHIDAVRRIDRIDGHAVNLVAAGDGDGDATELDPEYYED